MALGERIPAWFLGIDAFFELLSIIAIVLLIWFSYKSYKLIGEKKYFWFSAAFGIILLAFASRMFMHLCLYFGWTDFIGKVLHMLSWSAFVYVVFFLLAYIILFAIAMEIHDKKMMIAIFLLIALILYYSGNYLMIFQYIAIVLLFIIGWKYFEYYWKKRNKNTLLISTAFSFLCLSHIAFGLIAFTDYLYALGHLFQLIAYLIFLYFIIRVWKK
ncbi:hypothetical protein GF371_05380 [Candidatus Woesearchaeota archaeon]|nr:hypothetical protein [Candidatus Woesearchaeota archaeon]